ncbi:phosphate-starvation-inducible PsiE family protein [Microbulbifer pacificus]|uniref:Phosphate-starvation-inducible PsiE family protein n=1 Tax=Microbulbifer pacificus TaxID=407164 RepID=A0AAU0MZ95_9GAMM|nr:phosphate-starvation-inducible PsiE family protein [Microbulbifer pacificus]WOX05338.1 phosphate-starvation-inducible PsiE family protein [Microbulbifer pacificus]
MAQQKQRPTLIHEELPAEHEDPLIRVLHIVIRSSVRFLSVLMALVIMWSVADVVWVLYQRLSTDPVLLLDYNDLFDVFGAIMLVLISIEIFINIRLYLGSNVIPIQLVVATALMAIARKVIVLDLDDTGPMYILGIAAVVMALGITYWLVAKKEALSYSDRRSLLEDQKN